jgi:hypothetical protein
MIENFRIHPGKGSGPMRSAFYCIPAFAALAKAGTRDGQIAVSVIRRIVPDVCNPGMGVAD